MAVLSFKVEKEKLTQSTTVEVRQARVSDSSLLAPLFDAYRVFYGKASDVAAAHAFLLERLQHQQSVVFVALTASEQAIGFTQLYPAFSSVSMARAFILNDLFVAPTSRRSGVAVRLLDAAAEYARAVGAVRLSLSTAVDNQPAQALYVAQGWVRDTRFHAYTLPLSV